MRFFLIQILTLLSFQALAKININDANKALSNKEILTLKEQVRNALNFYNTFEKFDDDINIDINPAGCLRTSYNYIDKKISFCKTKNTIQMGINSIDIINHEIFHYLYCHTYPNHCSADKIKNKDIQSFHEGLADFFAYKMNPDSFFGEEYRVDIPYLRKYENNLCYRYSHSSHQRGSALSSTLIKNNSTFTSIANFMYSLNLSDLIDNFCLSTQDFYLTPKLRPLSKRNKYWLELNEEISFSYQLSEGYSLRLMSNLNLFKISIKNNELNVVSNGNKGVEKIVLHIISNNNIVGETRLYLGAR